MKIPAAMLHRMGACREQVAIVRKHWPNGIPVNQRSVNKVVRLGLGVGWFANRVLTPSALAEYQKVKASALVRLLLLPENWQTEGKEEGHADD